MEISFFSIGPSHSLYPEWMDLRQRILRDPLGLKYSASDLAEEAADQHRIACSEERVIAGFLIRTAGLAKGVWKIRQFAVDSTFQSSGVGRQMMEEAFREASEAQVTQLVLHSREAVCGFYEALGFEIVGEPFVEVGIPHRKMEITLPFPPSV